MDDMRNVHKNEVGNPEGESPLWRLNSLENDIEIVRKLKVLGIWFIINWFPNALIHFRLS
jgi:hypothetical protein